MRIRRRKPDGTWSEWEQDIRTEEQRKIDTFNSTKQKILKLSLSKHKKFRVPNSSLYKLTLIRQTYKRVKKISLPVE